jgi:phage gp46-like protein
VSDLVLLWSNEAFSADLAVVGADLGTDDGLRTAFIISLFSDAPARPDDVLPDKSDDRRGWWGDGFPFKDGDVVGSRLWLLSREKRIPDVLNRARDYAREALSWAIEDGICAAIDVTAERFGADGFAIGVVAHRPRGQDAARFDFVWENS